VLGRTMDGHGGQSLRERLALGGLVSLHT
jgi:hypothetical protein